MVKVYVHPRLVAEIEMLDQIRDFTDGTIASVSKYLKPYMTEEGQDPSAQNNFLNRKKRLYHINNCEPFIWIHLAHMSQPVKVTGWESDKQAAIYSDVEGEGLSQDQALEDYLWYYMRDGRVGILVEKQANIAATALDALESGERSFQSLFQSRHIVYWSKFRDGARKGQLSELLIREESELVDGKWYERYRQYKTDGTKYTVDLLRAKDDKGLNLLTTDEQELELIETLTGGVGFIPFVIIGESVEDSFLYSIVESNAAHMNLGSVVSNIIYNQGFQRNIITGATAADVKKMGEWLVTVLDNENTKVFTLEAGNPEAGFKEKAELNNHIYRRGKFEFNQLADDTRAIQSAESKERDMAGRKKLYDSTLARFQVALKKIWQMHAAFEGEATEGISVSIAREYGLEDAASKANKVNTVFTQAGVVGAKQTQQQVLKTSIQEITLIPNDGESKEDMLARLYADIDAGQQTGGELPPRPSISGLFQ